jgi:hypothetical protein
MKTLKTYLSALLMILSVAFSSLVGQTTSVYVIPHPDDWQLFMNPNAYHSIKGPNEKVIFLHITGGDGGAGTSSNFYLARQEGSLRAIRFMSNTFTNQGAPGNNMNETHVTINGHEILKFTYRNAVAYFLRLPDGNYSGNGYPFNNNESLQKLYNGTISGISAIDGSATYSSLSDLQTTLQAIVNAETTAGSSVVFHVADTDHTINPDDHSDHLYCSHLMQDVANNIGGVALNLYTEYYTSSKPQNVFNDDYLVSAGTWAVTASGISDNFFYSSWDNSHNIWLGKQYFRTLPPNNNLTASITALDVDASENPLDTATFAVSLNYVNTGSPLTINYTISGTATVGADFETISGSVTIPTGQQSQNIIITPVDDTEVEISETVTLTLEEGQGYNIIAPIVASVTIFSEDDFPPGTNLALYKPTTVSNGNSTKDRAVDGIYNRNNYWQGIPYPQWWQVDLGFVFDISKIKLTTYYGNNRYYHYDIQASTDGNNWTTIVDFNTNTTPATSQGNTFNLNNPQARYLRVNMNYNSANWGVHLMEFEAYGSLTNGHPEVTIAATNPIASESPLNMGTFTVVLNPPTTRGPLTINYTVSGTAEQGSDFLPLSGSVTIPAGQESGTIVITPIDDSEIETSETVILSLAPGSGYSIAAPSQGTVTIESNDAAPPIGNIALNKPTEASSGTERASANAVDGNYALNNWWGASPFPQWWRVDLGQAYDLTKLVVFTYYDGVRYYKYDIQGSLDGTNWTTLADFNSNVTPASNQGNTFNLNTPSARYIRVNMNYNSANPGVHIIEFEAYGSPSLQAGRNVAVLENDSATTEMKEATNFSLAVYPNPGKFGNPVKMGLKLDQDETAAIEIFDLTGKKLAGKTYNLLKGFNEVELPITYLSAGVLIVKVTIRNEISTKRVFLE